jgi:putative oxidoreductase
MGNSDLRAWATTLLRVVVGIVFVMHGGQKLFMGFSQVGGFLSQLGIPYSEISAIVLTVVELFGGIALVLGILARYVAVALAFDMAVAIITYHIHNGFFMPSGVEFPMVLLTANLTFILGGGGALELMHS